MTRKAIVQKLAAPAGSPGLYHLVDVGRQGEPAGMCPSFTLNRQDLMTWLIREGATYSDAEALLARVDAANQGEIEIPIRVGPQIVRAWFDTVFAPLSAEIRTEISLLDQRNWTFNYRLGAFEHLRPIRSYLDDSGRQNLEQLLTLNPELDAAVGRHDELLLDLLSAVRSLHETMTSHGPLRRRVDAASGPESLAALGYASAEVVFGAYPIEDRYKLIAQYVVNHAPGQPPWLATAKLWNTHRSRFMAILEKEELAPAVQQVVIAGSSLRESCVGLYGLLESKRLELSLIHDVPYSSLKSGLPAA